LRWTPVWKLGERCAVAQRARFALHDRQIMPPVVDRLAGAITRTVDDAAMLAHDLAFSGDDDPIRINPKAYRPIGEGCRNAVAVALQMHEAGRRDPLGVFDEAIEWT
jgi:hypothetical protein